MITMLNSILHNEINRRKYFIVFSSEVETTGKIFIYLLQVLYFLSMTRMCTTAAIDSKTHSLVGICLKVTMMASMYMF